MIELLRFRQVEKAGLLQSILESEGIPTFLSNEDSLAFPDSHHALCIMNGTDKDRALTVIRAHMESAPQDPAMEVTCPHCGERVPGNFATCWNCGAPMDAPS